MVGNDMVGNDKIGPERTRLNFANAVRTRFGFLESFGFIEIESTPTIVRYRNGDLVVDIYHGRNSYELGFGITRHGTRYSLGTLMHVINPEAAKKYRNFAATTHAGVTEGLSRLEELVKKYGRRSLQGDSDFFKELEKQNKLLVEEYALDVLAAQVRPKADAAFQRGDYREAAGLYEKILTRLNDTELKKMAIAKKRAGL